MDSLMGFFNVKESASNTTDGSVCRIALDP